MVFRFVESQRSVKNDPLVLWLTGGTDNFMFFFEFFLFGYTKQRNQITLPFRRMLSGLITLLAGPGCSGINALLTENGPFHPNRDGETLFENVFAWNKV